MQLRTKLISLLYIIVELFFFTQLSLAGGGSLDVGGGNTLEQYFVTRAEDSYLQLLLLDQSLQEGYFNYKNKDFLNTFREFTDTIGTEGDFSKAKVKFHHFIYRLKDSLAQCKVTSAIDDKDFCEKAKSKLNIQASQCQEYLKDNREGLGNGADLVLRESKFIRSKNTDKIQFIDPSPFDTLVLHEYVQNCLQFQVEDKSKQISNKLKLLVDFIRDPQFHLSEYTDYFPKVLAQGKNIDKTIKKGGGQFGVDTNLSQGIQRSWCSPETNGSIVLNLYLPTVQGFDHVKEQQMMSQELNRFSSTVSEKKLTSEPIPFIERKDPMSLEECFNFFEQINPADMIYYLKGPLKGPDAQENPSQDFRIYIMNEVNSSK